MLVGAAGCGNQPRVLLPTGAGAPFPEFTTAFTEATADCGGVQRLSASIKLSGRAGGTRLSARIDAGFAAPAQIRLEGYPPVSFGGKPFFILVSSRQETTLVMPRDARVLRGAAPAAIVEALAGVALGPADLRAIVAGCGLHSDTPSSGRSFANGWAALDAGETTVFLRQVAGRWRVAGATRGTLSVTYADFAASRPSTVHVTAPAARGGAAADLVLRLSQIEIDPALDDHVFEVEVPRDAVPLTLEELRRAGPLGEQHTEATEGTDKFQHGGAEARRAPVLFEPGRAPGLSGNAMRTSSSLPVSVHSSTRVIFEPGRAPAFGRQVESRITEETQTAAWIGGCLRFSRDTRFTARRAGATGLHPSPCLRASVLEFFRGLPSSSTARSVS
jgi:hypothetical protein